MTESLPVIKIMPSRMVDLYDESGITPGTKVLVQNVGSNSVRLYESVAAPTHSSGYNILEENKYAYSSLTPVGIWASSGRSTLLQVEEV